MSYPPSYDVYRATPQNELGAVGMVLGILGVLLSVTVIFGLICGGLAISFGSIGRSRTRQGLATNHGQATAGFVTGIVAVVLSLGLVVMVMPSV